MRGAAGLQLKRAFDVVGATALLVVLSPLLALIAVAIRLDSRGPALFRQTRAGRDDVPFEILKFRSMVVDADRDGMVTALGDPRVTRVGRILRMTSLDELPQLVNVVAGQMSLVGPRPLLPGTVQPHERRRLDVRPGCTGLPVVSGRQSIDWDERIALDLRYVDEWTFWLDLRILAKTVLVVLSRQGVYDEDGEMKPRGSSPGGGGVNDGG